MGSRFDSCSVAESVPFFSGRQFIILGHQIRLRKKFSLEHCDDDVDDYDSGGDADVNHGDDYDYNDDDDDDDDESNGNKLLSLYYYESDNDNVVVY